jgi:hypothetical protein
VSVEVHISDLNELDYYIDEKCKELEEVLRKDFKFAEYRVKRQHWGEDGEFDTFVIQDPEGVDLVTLNTWEVDTLNEDEFLSYTDVQIRREQHSYIERAFFFVLTLAIFVPIGMSPILFGTLLSPGFTDTIFAPLSLVAWIIILLSMIIFYRKRKQVIFEQQQIDIQAARENSAFLYALRKLASLTGEEVWMRDEFQSRLQYIEDTLVGER